jgi:serralysin
VVSFEAFRFFGSVAVARNCSLAISDYQQVSSGAWVDLSQVEELRGDFGDDTFTGSLFDDVLRGGDGDDQLHGSGGFDTLVGGLGNDLFDGGGGVDWADFSGASERVTVLLNLSGAHNTQQGTDSFTSIECLLGSAFNDILFGSTANNQLKGEGGNDILSGREGKDTVDGGAGKDTLMGGSEADTLIGGGGVDTFAFEKTGDSPRFASDLIWDLGAADVIRLSNIDANTTVAGDQAFVLGGTGSGSARLTYNADTGLTSLSLYTNADRLIDAVILIRGNHVDHDNFVL